MSRHPKAVQDEAEAEAIAAAEEEDMEARIEAELDHLDDLHVAFGHIPGYSQFGFPEDDDYLYLGPVIAKDVENEADMSSSPEDWREFLRKIEEDLK